MIGFLLGAAMAAAAVESPIEASGPLAPLSGTLLTPDRPQAPVVLILPGSGPTDREGNSLLGLTAQPYRLLALALAERGIASVRIDKRGLFASRAAVASADGVTMADYTSDVAAWIGAIRARTHAPCVWLLGHSEGGAIALTAARAEGVCGVVLVSTVGRPLGVVLREQIAAAPAFAADRDKAFAALTELEAGRHVATDGMSPAMLSLFRPSVQGFMISALAIDPARLASAVDRPLLIVQGTRDLQVSLADADSLHQAAPRARLLLVPGMNHVLKAVASDDRAANLATYVDPSLPLTPGLADGIAEFVLHPPR